MLKVILKGIVLTALWSCASTALSSVLHTIGMAHAEDNTLLYIEHHQYLEDGTHIARYFNPELTLRLEKRLSYPGLPQHPDIQQMNLLSTESISIRSTADELEMVSSLPDRTRRYRLALAPDVIIDAGFDAYIQANWSSFLPDEERQFRLAVAGKPDFINVTLKKMASDVSVARFSIEPTNWVTRLIVKGITLSYDNERRLQVYEGPPGLSLAPSTPRRVAVDFRHYRHHEQLDLPLPNWLENRPDPFQHLARTTL